MGSEAQVLGRLMGTGSSCGALDAPPLKVARQEAWGQASSSPLLFRQCSLSIWSHDMPRRSHTKGILFSPGCTSATYRERPPLTMARAERGPIARPQRVPDRHQGCRLDGLGDVQQRLDLAFVLGMQRGQHGAEPKSAGGQQQILDGGVDRGAPRDRPPLWPHFAVIDTCEDEHGHAAICCASSAPCRYGWVNTSMSAVAACHAARYH